MCAIRNPQELGYNGRNLQRLFSSTAGERDGLVKPVHVGDLAKIAVGLGRGLSARDPDLAYAVYLSKPTYGSSLLVASRVRVNPEGRVQIVSGVIPSVAVGRATVPEVLEGRDEDVFQDQVGTPQAITFTLEGLVDAKKEMDPLQHPEGFAGKLLGKMFDARTSLGADEIDLAVHEVFSSS